jgi:hypothetical protein
VLRVGVDSRDADHRALDPGEVVPGRHVFRLMNEFRLMNDNTYPLAGTRVNRVAYGDMQIPGRLMSVAEPLNCFDRASRLLDLPWFLTTSAAVIAASGFR